MPGKYTALLSELWQKHSFVIRYLFFGFCAAFLNTLCYALLYQKCGLSNVLSTVLAWAAAVVFAYVCNKFFVFESHRSTLQALIREFFSFVSIRILTGVLDVGIMFLAVDCLQLNDVFWKLLSNVIVTVLNYIASKFLIFTASRKN